MSTGRPGGDWNEFKLDCLRGRISRSLAVKLLRSIGKTTQPDQQTKPQIVTGWGRESGHCHACRTRSSWPDMRNTGTRADASKSNSQTLHSQLSRHLLAWYCPCFVLYTISSFLHLYIHVPSSLPSPFTSSDALWNLVVLGFMHLVNILVT